ncbi:MAG: 5'/3'-nucleotidase SurE [Clostridia bacterium]|nr:5'/3'-nucleotidase SurE [Clostridia bacterium]
MNILLVNDDGFDSAYLREFCRMAADRGHRVRVCAPMFQQSAKSHSFTILEPVLTQERKMDGAERAWAIAGTPVDCSRIGFLELYPEAEIVISGINNGLNEASSVYPSGTVAAAREAALYRLPAMAVSAGYCLPDETLRYYIAWCLKIAERLIVYDRPDRALLNVNIPGVPLAELKAPVFCPPDPAAYENRYIRREDPRGNTYFWLGPEVHNDHPSEGTDIWYLNRGHITCTFIGPYDLDQSRFADLLEDTPGAV